MYCPPRTQIINSIVHREHKLSTVLSTTTLSYRSVVTMNAHYWWCYPQWTWVIDGVVLTNISYRQCCPSWTQAIDNIVYHEHRLATVLSIPNTSYRQHWWYIVHHKHKSSHHEHKSPTALSTGNMSPQQCCPPWPWVIDSIVHHEHMLLMT